MYLLFSGNVFYPAGGWEDFIGHFNTIPEAKARFAEIVREESGSEYLWAHIVDPKVNRIIAWYEDDRGWMPD